MARPSSYDPTYCERAIEFLKDGYSIGALAGELGVARSSIFKWMQDHPEFSDAIKTGQAASQLWWEKRNRDFSLTGEGNATAIVFGLKNRARDDWQDITKQEVSGPNGAPVETVQRIERVIIDPQDTDA